MAVSAGTVWEVETGGSDSNGGGFDASLGGTDYTLSGSPIATGTVTVSGTTCTATTAIFTSLMVGNYITEGTNWRRITAFTSTTVVTLEATVAWTSVAIKVGGALLSPGLMGALAVDGNIIYIKGGTYSISSASVNVSGGTIGPLNNTAALYVGYTSNRTTTNTDTQPILQYTVASVTMFSGSHFFSTVYNITCDGNGQTSAAWTSAQGSYVLCTIKNMNTASSSAGNYTNCLATANSAAPFSAAGRATGCEAYSNTASPFPCQICVDCLSYNNTGASTDGFITTGAGTPGLVINCTAYGNGRDGFRAGTVRGNVFINCYAEANTGAGFHANSTQAVQFINCGSYNNSGGRSNVTSTNNVVDSNPITLSGTAFVAAGSNNFALNSTASQGALLRAAGFPGVMPRGTTTGYLDVGAAQSKIPSNPQSLIQTSIGTY